MKLYMTKINQGGIALTSVLLILIVALVLGLSSITVSTFEEKMAGNQRNSVAALMAAEAGLSNAQRVISQKISLNEPVSLCGTGWDELTTWNGGVAGGGDLSVQQNVGYSLWACVSDNGKFRLRSQGVVFAGSGSDAEQVVARWVAAEGFTFSGFLGFSTIMNLGGFAPPDDDFWAGGGNLEVSGNSVNGVYNDAIAVPDDDATPTQTQQEYTEEQVENTKGSVVYNGSVSDGISESILRDAALFYDFIFGAGGLKDSADNREEVSGSVEFSQDDFGSVVVADDGSVSGQKLTFIDGDFYDAGNFSGAGVMIINGDATFKGTPSFQGLMIVLGDYTIAAGGGNGPYEGSLVVSPFVNFEEFTMYGDVSQSDPGCLFNNGCAIRDGIEYYENPEGFVSSESDGPAISFSSAAIDLGRGNASYTYDVDALKWAESILPDDLKEMLNEQNISQNTIEGFAIDRWQEILSLSESGWPGDM